MLKEYDKELIDVLSAVVAMLPDNRLLVLQILHRKDWGQYSFCLQNPNYGTAVEADWMDKEKLLPALKEMVATFELMIQDLEERGGL